MINGKNLAFEGRRRHQITIAFGAYKGNKTGIIIGLFRFKYIL